MNNPRQTHPIDNKMTLSRATLVREIGRYIRDENARNFEDEEDTQNFETFGVDADTVDIYMSQLTDEVVSWLKKFQK